jgi:hypothetical protein
MAGAGHNHQHNKYSYFHCNSPLLSNKTSAVCTSTHQDRSMMSSSTSPWYYHPSPITGDNDEPTQATGPVIPIETGTMIKPPSSSSLNPDCSTNNMQCQENHGHFFVKKTFHKPTYCHHCVEMLWGLIGQGYCCEGKQHIYHSTRKTNVHRAY